MTIQLPNDVHSPQGLKSMIMEVQDYAKWFSHESIKERRGIRQDAEPPTVTPGAAEVLNEWAKQQPLSVQSLDELIRQLQHISENASVVTITLAAPAPSKLKDSLTAWCRTNLGAGTLVSFRFNTTLLGGMVVRYGSHIHDWSIRRQILQSKSKFPEILRRV